MAIFLMNAPVLTAHGVYKFTALSPEEARELALEDGKLKSDVISAIGHSATASYLASLLGVDSVPVQRIAITMKAGDKAIVLRSLDRLPEGKVLSIDEMRDFRWELSLIERID